MIRLIVVNILVKSEAIAWVLSQARKALRRLKGVEKFPGVIGGQCSVKNQTTSALNHIHFWSKMQSEIRARWLGMVVESRARQKRLENQLKLEAKIHEFEVFD